MRLPESVELDPEQLESLPPFTRNFFEKAPPPKGIEPIAGGEQVFFPVEQEVESRLGKDWRNIVAIVMVSSRIQNIIRPGKDAEETKQKISGTTVILFLMGYELGENLKRPLSDAIADRLKHQSTFDQQLNDSGEGIQEYRETCFVILQAGAWARGLYSAPVSEPSLVATGT